MFETLWLCYLCSSLWLETWSVVVQKFLALQRCYKCSIMVKVNNEYFPRGGKRIPQGDKKVKRRHEETLFPIGDHPKPKKICKEKKIEKESTTEESWHASLKLHGTLAYNKMQEGVAVLGCVKHISNLAVQLELPGLTFGLVTINRISDAFTNILTDNLRQNNGEGTLSALKDIFEIGQFVTARIISIERTDKGYEVQATINPKDIYSKKVHHNFQKGITVWANFVSQLDHGYELTVGVENCRVFLPLKNVDTKKIGVGQPLFCVVHKAENATVATTLTVSSKQEHLDKIHVNNELHFSNVVPGLKVKFIVENISAAGLRGHFLNNYFGYIDETQIFSKVDIKKLKEGTTLPAYVLFIEPVTKVTYLTLRGLQSLPPPQYEVGKLCSAEVKSNIAKGLYIKLSTGEIGFVTNKRLLKTLPHDAKLDVFSDIHKKYPVGSRHQCRILDYSYMQQTYICTFEKQIIKEKIFHFRDLTLGQQVKVKVDKVVANGLVVKVGHVQGFVPNLHLSNVQYSDFIKGKYSEGTTVNARVLNVTPEDNVIFTVKQGLVASNNCLTRPEDAVPNSQFVGFVVQTKKEGALVAFYGNMKGWIHNKMLNADRYTDPRNYFFLGQVVNVWILGYKHHKLQLSVTCPDHLTKGRIKLGQEISGRVTAINDNRLDVELGKHKVEATVPVAHLASSLALCPVLLKTYAVGQWIPDLMCIKCSDTIVMSRREYLAFSARGVKVPSFFKLKKGMLLRCSVVEQTDAGIYVSTPIRNYSENVLILKNNIHLNGELCVFMKDQLVVANILYVSYKPAKIVLGIESNRNWRDDNINKCLDLLIENITSLDNIYRFGYEDGWKLCAYKIGETVQCKLQRTDSEGNYFVLLPNGVKGLIASNLSAPNLKIGSYVAGIILDYNFIDEYVEVSCRNDINRSINKTQDGTMRKALDSSSSMKILLYTKLYAVGVLKDSNCNRQLVYLPLHFEENDNSMRCFYDGAKKLEVVLYGRFANRIIGVPKKLASDVKGHKNVNDTEEEKKASNFERNVNKVKEETTDISEEENLNVTEVEEANDTEVEEEMNDTEEEEEEMNDTREEEEEINEAREEEEEEINASEEEEMNNTEEEREETNDLEAELSDLEEIDTTINGSKKASVDNMRATSANKNTVNQQEVSLVDKCHNSRSDEILKSKAVLSGISSFYVFNCDKDVKEESSSDDDVETKEPKKAKKKITPAERVAMAKLEEDRIAKIEKEMMEPTTAPHSAEQFDKLLLASPNSSELWLKYMAMHIAATELEKARSVGKRALETINMTLVKEKFNLWIALLNLENMYGTKASFEKLFEDAVRYNDSLDIYLNVIKMFAVSGKLNEMEEKIKRVRCKEKQNTKMWLEISEVYYSLGKFREARNVKDAALKSILDKRRQFDLIVRFGIMEFQAGELEQAIANFEAILEAYPSKINIWIIYVDQLVKKGKVHLARHLLERAAGQKFSVKSMKAIYQKFVSFEEQHGTLETVEKVKKRTKEYIKTAGLK